MSVQAYLEELRRELDALEVRVGNLEAEFAARAREHRDPVDPD
jgi:BMFP domain-containing protein YqiC